MDSNKNKNNSNSNNNNNNNSNNSNNNNNNNIDNKNKNYHDINNIDTSYNSSINYNSNSSIGTLNSSDSNSLNDSKSPLVSPKEKNNRTVEEGGIEMFSTKNHRHNSSGSDDNHHLKDKKKKDKKKDHKKENSNNIKNSKNININNNNNNNNNYSSDSSDDSDDGIIKSPRIRINEEVRVISPRDEKESISKVINRENNLTSSAPSIVKSPTNHDSLSPTNHDNNNGYSIKKSTTPQVLSPKESSAIKSPTQMKESGFNTVSSYPTELNRLSGGGADNPLNKAQELPYQVITLNDLGDHSKDEDFPPDKSSDEEDEEEEKKKKKKKKPLFKRLFTVKFFIILVLILLLLISAVGVIFRIFWPHIEIVQVQILRWALYIDIAVVGYLLVYWIVRAFFSIFSSTMYLQQHVFYYVNGFVRPLSCLLWAIIVYFATQPVLELPDYTRDSMEKYYTALKAVMYVSLFYCGRVVLVKILAARTNRKAFYTSLKESLLNEELLEQLSTRKPSALSQSVSASLKKKKKMGISQWIESLKTRNQLSGKLNSRAEQFTQIEARKIAKQILRNADRDKKGYLVKNDLNGYVKEKHVEKAFNTIGSIHGDQIKKDDLTNWILRVVRSRKTLEYRLRDHEDIGRVINEIVNFIFWVLMFLFVMTLYGVEVSVFLVPLSTTILALSFAFGTTLRNVFESLILIFFVRPYEVGDKVVINQLEALFVDRIGIVFTSFKTMDGKAVYLPNSTLVLARIENFQRSEDVSVGLDVTVNFNTPVEKLYMIESKLDKWVKAQPEKWRPDIYMSFSNIIGTNQIVVRYGGSIICTWQDGRRIRILKNDFLFKMKEWLSEANFETFPAKQQVELLNHATEAHFSIPNPILR